MNHPKEINMGYTNYYCIDSLTDEVLADAKKLRMFS